MKKLISLIIMCFAFATVGFASDGKHFHAELGIGWGKAPNNYSIITPRFAYRFSDRLEAGAFVHIEDTKFLVSNKKDENRVGTVNKFGAYAEYAIIKFKGFSGFVDFNAAYCHQLWGDHLDGGRPRKQNNGYEIGFTPGICYTVPGIGLDFKLRYLFVGLNNIRNTYVNIRDIDGCVTRGNFMLDGSFRRFEIAIGYSF